jgi:hypothetical protein
MEDWLYALATIVVKTIAIIGVYVAIFMINAALTSDPRNIWP